MTKPLKDLVQRTICIAKAKTEDAQTTVFRSKQLPELSFNDQYQRFVRYAQQRAPNFTVDVTSRPVVTALLAYFLQNRVQCQEQGISLQKGLFLMGSIGCGKTPLMQLFAEGLQNGSHFRVITARDVTRQFLREGYSVIDRYGASSFRTKHLGYGPVLQYDQPLTYCFDDIGAEAATKRYGNDCNVIAEVLLDRYDQFVQRGMITHLTTNLDAEALEDYYGDRVRSRLREMCNLICFPTETEDRRE